MAGKKLDSLEAWMTASGVRDEELALKIGVSRVQISRLRRKINGASVVTAKKLERLTGIPWHAFLSGDRT